MTAEPRVIVVGPRRQRFLGFSYSPGRGDYFQRSGKALHREVWASHNGPIPPAHHVHHIDHDRANNQIENLELIAAAEHVRQHTSTPEHKARAIEHLRKGQHLGAAWQKTPEGRAKHRAHRKAQWDAMPWYTHECVLCGASYRTHALRPWYCSHKCRVKAEYRLKAWGNIHRKP